MKIDISLPSTEEANNHVTLLQVSCDGFSVPSDATAVHHHPTNSRLLFVSLIGSQAASRAMAAKYHGQPAKNHPPPRARSR